MGMPQAMQAHLDTGLTTLCRAWSILRADGVRYGFTDHDCTLRFDDTEFRADTGLTALALQQTTGLSVDNTEALGALCDASLTEEDILAGRFDGATVTGWLVNWRNVAEREMVFRGTIGEITRVDGAFRAEVRGLSEALNRPMGRVIQRTSPVLVGDDGQPFNLMQPGYFYEGPIVEIDGRAAFIVQTQGGFADGWFRQGGMQALSGDADGLKGVIKRDEAMDATRRRIELWEPLRVALRVGDRVRILAGYDGRFETCRLKFNNGINFRGFPDVPEDDWVITAAPTAPNKSGGSRR